MGPGSKVNFGSTFWNKVMKQKKGRRAEKKFLETRSNLKC